MTTKRFSELGLSAELLRAIDRLGFELASPIQAAAIPPLLQGQDVVGQSQTGSGKTAAFGAPAVERVAPAVRAVQVLILCPTRELAIQVCEDVNQLAYFRPGVQALPIYGGQSYERQFLGLKRGAQIVIGTPGRLMDHMRRGTLELGTVRLVVLDEADEMLNMGFRDDIEFILKATPADRQTVFFSATFPRPIQDLIQNYARTPVSIRIEQKAATVPTVEQVYYEVDRRRKLELLTRLIDLHDLRLGIVFCNTKRMVDDLVDHLNAQGYSADGLHGDMGQAMRDRVMGKFRQSGLEFLVATDVAARGLDVDDVQVVFNYDLPYDPEDYVHRIGRTGRAGRSGLAIAFASGRELFQIQHIERYTRTRIHRERPPTQAEVEEARASALLERLRAMLTAGDFPRQDHLVERLLEEGFNSTDIASALIHLLQGEEAAAPTRAPQADGRRGESSRDRRGSEPPGGPKASERWDRPGEKGRAAKPRPARTEARPAPATKAASPPSKPSATPSSSTGSAPSAGSDVLRPSAPATPPQTEPAPPRPSDSPSVVAESTGTPVAAATPPSAEASSVATSLSSPPILPSASQTREVPEATVHAESAALEATAVAPPAAPTAVATKPTTPEPVPAAIAPVANTARAASSGPEAPTAPAPPEAAPTTQPPLAPTSSARRTPPPATAGEKTPWRPGAPRPGKPQSRATPADQTRLYMSVGQEMGVGEQDVVRAILGETGLPANAVGRVDLRERHLFVDVAAEHAKGIVAKLNRTLIKGLKVKVKIA